MFFIEYAAKVLITIFVFFTLFICIIIYSIVIVWPISTWNFQNGSQANSTALEMKVHTHKAAIHHLQIIMFSLDKYDIIKISLPI